MSDDAFPLVVDQDSGEDDELTGDVALLRNAIAKELHAQLAMRNETIDLADVPEVAYAVAVQLGHGFRIEWAPDWTDTEDGEPVS
jgi:hypothetical protein